MNLTKSFRTPVCCSVLFSYAVSSYLFSNSSIRGSCFTCYYQAVWLPSECKWELYLFGDTRSRITGKHNSLFSLVPPQTTAPAVVLEQNRKLNLALVGGFEPSFLSIFKNHRVYFRKRDLFRCVFDKCQMSFNFVFFCFDVVLFTKMKLLSQRSTHSHNRIASTVSVFSRNSQRLIRI